MFDANMKGLPKGVLFFAEVHGLKENSSLVDYGVKVGDILLCTMLSIGDENPRVKVHFPIGPSTTIRSWDTHCEDKLFDTYLIFSGYLKDDKTLGGFIQDCWKAKARDLVDTFENIDKIIRPF